MLDQIKTYTENIESTINNCTDYCYLLEYKEQVEKQFEDKIREIEKTIEKMTPIVDLASLLNSAADMLNNARNDLSEVNQAKNLVCGQILTKLTTLETELKKDLSEIGEDITNIDMSQYCKNREL